MNHPVIESTVNKWGNGLAVRLNQAVTRSAGVVEGTPVRIITQPGRIIIETKPSEPTLEEMLDAFDPARHGGEAMAFGPVGLEVV